MQLHTPFASTKKCYSRYLCGGDCDDTGALAVLHALADKGEVNILALGCCISDPNSAPTIQAINTYYGRPNIPVGTLKDLGLLPGPFTYIKYIAANFPNTLKSGVNAPDAFKLYRQTLAAQPDNSVTLISIGPLRNIKNLLQSGADSYSSLNGLDLVAKKVSKYVLMGGQFASGSEWNMNQDGPSAEYVINNFPSNIEMVFSQMHIGSNISTGARLTTETPATNPVRKAYEIYSGIGKNNASWDQTAVLYAIRGLGAQWNLETNGYCYIDGTGYAEWRSSPDKNQSYIKWISQAQSVTAAKELGVIIEDLMVKFPSNTVIAFPVTSVSLNTTQANLALGTSFSLVAIALPGNATNHTVTWASSNPAIATVSTRGVVTAVGIGSATITVTTVDGGKTATCTSVNTYPPVTVIASSENVQSGEAVDKLVDGDLLTKWGAHGAMPLWVVSKYNYNTVRAWNKYSLTSGNDNPTRDLRDWTLEASNDSSTWVTLDTQTGHAPWNARNSTLDFAFTNAVAYTYYKFNITANNGDGDYTQLSEIQFSNSTSTGIANTVSKDFSIYPNPSKTELFFKSNFSGNVTYEITTIEGKTLQSGIVNSSSIAIETLKAGIYIVKIKTEAGEALQRFVKE